MIKTKKPDELCAVFLAMPPFYAEAYVRQRVEREFSRTILFEVIDIDPRMHESRPETIFLHSRTILDNIESADIR